MYSQISVRWVRLSSFLVNSVSTVGFILIVIFGILVHFLGLVGLPWSLWSLGEIVLTETLGANFGWLLFATAICSIVFAILWLAGIVSGTLSNGFHGEDWIVFGKVVLSIIITLAGAVVVLNVRAELPGIALLVPWLNLGLWVWALAGYS